MKYIKTILFGVKVKGLPLEPPRLRSSYPINRPDENQWAKEMKFGSRYGHRGSFYQNR